MENELLEEIKNRCIEQNIDIDGCYIMFVRNGVYFEGEKITGYTESKDEKWVCIPMYDDELSMISDGYEYSPQCFEVKQKMTTYLLCGSMWSLTTIWLLHKP